MCEKDWIPEDYSCTFRSPQTPLCLIVLDNHYCLITEHWKFKAVIILLRWWLKRLRKKTKTQKLKLNELLTLRDQPNLAWALPSQIMETKPSLYFLLFLHATHSFLLSPDSVQTPWRSLIFSGKSKHYSHGSASLTSLFTNSVSNKCQLESSRSGFYGQDFIRVPIFRMLWFLHCYEKKILIHLILLILSQLLSFNSPVITVNRLL